MNPFEGLLVLLGFPAVMLLCGYWLAATNAHFTSSSERLAAGLLAGLTVLLFMIGAINLFAPLKGVSAWLCLCPALVTLGRSEIRAQLRNDVRASLWQPRAIAWAGGMVLMLGIILEPMLRDSAIVYFDGTSNHDGFFWITAADHLKHHTYLEAPPTVNTRPALGVVQAITGWTPVWGRMGAEGLLALASALFMTSALKLYMYALASFSFVWGAGVYLVARSYISLRLGVVATFALAGLQPLFAYYFANANYPNLIGVLSGTTLIIAIQRISACPPEPVVSWKSAILLALSLHGLLCSYPEMLPFVGLPVALLIVRCARHRAMSGLWPQMLCGPLLLGAIVNPVTAVRAISGSYYSITLVAANENWADIFRKLSTAEFLPALFTLSTKSGQELDNWGGLAVTSLLVGCAVIVLRRARDPMGLAILFSGAAVLASYTSITGFIYGWQKTIQVSGIFWAALLPVGALQVLTDDAAAKKTRWLRYLAASLVFMFFCYSLAIVRLDVIKWSERKHVGADWFQLRDFSRQQLANRAILVDSSSFEHSFFHSMWAAYYLQASDLYYFSRGYQSGGYLNRIAAKEDAAPVGEAIPTLAGREWAEAVDPTAIRLVNGEKYLLLRDASRVLALEGVSPAEGVPRFAETQFSLTAQAPAGRVFQVRLAAPAEAGKINGYWLVTTSSGSHKIFATKSEGRALWNVEVPLLHGSPQRIAFQFHPAPGAAPLTKPMTLELFQFRPGSGATVAGTGP